MSASEYRQNAADCLKLAQALTDLAGKASLLGMAQAWMRLAEQAETNDMAAMRARYMIADRAGR